MGRGPVGREGCLCPVGAGYKPALPALILGAACVKLACTFL